MVTFDDLIKEGYRVRPARFDDLEAAVNLYNICSHIFLGSDECRPDEVQQEWELPAFNLESATRVVLSPKGNLVGYIEVWDVKDPPVNTYVWGRVHPDLENKGIGKAMMEWAESRARKAISRTPDHARVVMRSFVFSTYPFGIKLLEDADMRLIRHIYRMRINLATQPPPPQWPEGIQLRPFDLDRDAEAVYLAEEDAFLWIRTKLPG
jgi:GNAT superfamily N-acetyltransferase